MNTLIVGGTSGLGLELARSMAAADEEVIVTGRNSRGIDFAGFHEFELTTGNIAKRIGEFVMHLPVIDSFIFSAGNFLEGRITDVSDEDDEKTFKLGQAPHYFVKKLLSKQNELDELVIVTSTSEWTGRLMEPGYTEIKAANGQLANSLSLDTRIKKTLKVAPSGMAGPEGHFWDGTTRDTSKMMPYGLVASQVQLLRSGEFDKLPLHNVDPENPPIKAYRYCSARILGENNDLPQRVEIVETRA